MSNMPTGNFSTPAFIIKLYDMLDDHNRSLFDKIIRWSDDGEYFIVVQPKLMETEVLQLYFKHNHFTSFLRQLNMYEFVKARNSENNQVFSHPHFKRSQKQLLSLIKRNPIKSEKKIFIKVKAEPKLNYQKVLERELNEVKTQQSAFEGQFATIMRQNDSILEQHRQIWNELHTSRKSVDMKIERISYLLSHVLRQQTKRKPDEAFKSLDQGFQPVKKESYKRIKSDEAVQDFTNQEPNLIQQLLENNKQSNDNNFNLLLSPLWKQMSDFGNFRPNVPLNLWQLSPSRFFQEEQLRQQLFSPQHIYQLCNNEMMNQSPLAMSPYPFKQEGEEQ